MTFCAMSSAKLRHKSEDDIIFERLRKSITKGLRTLIFEIAGNYGRVCRLLVRVWLWFLCYFFFAKCSIQHVLHQMEQYAEMCEKDTIYSAPYSVEIKNRIYLNLYKQRKISCEKCICRREFSNEYEELLELKASALTSWLRQYGLRATFEDRSQWNDGTLFTNIIQHIAELPNTELKGLNPSNRVKNWSLIISVIKRKYPGLIQNKLLLNCVTSSKSIHLHHVIEILTRLMYARRRVWMGRIIRRILSVTNVISGFLKPACLLSGPGIVYAKLNTRNEIVVRTGFPCPPFTFELADDRGEIWRDTTENAKSSSHQEEHADQYSYSNSLGIEQPIEILRVSKSHYRIFYFPRISGTYKISIRPGINKGGHIKGSPLYILAEAANYWRKSLVNEKSPLRRMSSVKPPPICTQVSASGQYESFVPEETRREEVEKINSNGSISTSHKDDVTSKTTSLEEQNYDENKNYRGFRKLTVGIFRNIGNGLSTVSQRVFSSMSSGGENTAYNANNLAGKRRTYANTFSSRYSKSMESSELIVPPSRNLRIRNVIVHRYLNVAMPSLEEYFFGEGGFKLQEEESCGGKSSSKRWRNISALLRVKMKMMSSVQNEEKDNTKKKTTVRKLEPENGKRRRLRSADLYRTRQENRRSSGDIFSRRNTACISSSSSESSYEVNDLETIVDEEKHISRLSVKKKEKYIVDKKSEVKKCASVSPHTPRFNHIFDNQTGAADILLQDTAVPNSRNSESLRLRGNSTQHKAGEITPSGDKMENGDVFRRDAGSVNSKSGENQSAEKQAPPDRKKRMLQYAEEVVETVLRNAIIEYNELIKA